MYEFLSDNEETFFRASLNVIVILEIFEYNDRWLFDPGASGETICEKVLRLHGYSSIDRSLTRSYSTANGLVTDLCTLQMRSNIMFGAIRRSSFLWDSKYCETE